MAKLHKYMWTGVDIDTALEPDRLQLAAHEAANAAGGKFKIEGTSGPALLCYVLGLLGGLKILTFDVEWSEAAAGRRAARTTIVRATTSQATIMLIPIGPKTMNGHSVYHNFYVAFGQIVGAMDPSARITFRDGPMPEGFAYAALGRSVMPPATAR